MFTRRLRKLLREPYWLLLLALFLLGAVVGIRLADSHSDEGEELLGRAWRGDARETREVLVSLFTFQVTVLTVVLSLNAPVIQSAANQYSPRLVPIYLKSAPLRRAVPLFVFSGGYLVAAVRELGLLPDESVRPRLVLTVALVLVFAALAALVFCTVRTFRYMRVERVLGLVQDLIFASSARLRACLERLPLAAAPSLVPPAASTGLLAPASGYLAEVDLRRLVRHARRADVQVRICRAVGEYVDQGEPLGQVWTRRGPPPDARLLRRLSRTLVLTPVREADFDPTLGIRILVDVAGRALSTSSNDPYTARQALQKLRSVLRHLSLLPLGDWNVSDRDGQVRVSVMATSLREWLSLAVEGPLHYGAGEPEVLEGVLEIALVVAHVARQPEDRAAAHALLARVLQDVAALRHLERERLRQLRADAEELLGEPAREVPAREELAHVEARLLPH